MAKLNNKEKEWVEIRQRFQLSHAQVQMARELELLPRALAKQPDVPGYLQLQYQERFGRPEPEVVVSIENRARQEQRDNAMEKIARQKEASMPKEPEPPPPPPPKPAVRVKKKKLPDITYPGKRPRKKG